MILSHAHLGDIGHTLLILYRGVFKGGILDRVELGARRGVGGDIQYAGGVGDRRIVFVVIDRSVGRGLKAVHHIAADINVVMAHENRVDVELFKDRNECVSAAQDILVDGVGCDGIDRVMEHDDLPLDILILDRADAVQHELPVFGGRQVIAVEDKEQCLVVYKIAVAAGIGLAVLA